MPKPQKFVGGLGLRPQTPWPPAAKGFAPRPQVVAPPPIPFAKSWVRHWHELTFLQPVPPMPRNTLAQ